MSPTTRPAPPTSRSVLALVVSRLVLAAALVVPAVAVG